MTPYEQKLALVLGRHTPFLRITRVLDRFQQHVPGLEGTLFTVTESYSISRDGVVSMSRVTPLAFQGGEGTLPAGSLEAIDPILRRLPPDSGRLPAATQRLVVQIEKDGRIAARLYDRANLPNAVLELLRALDLQVRPVLLDCTPDRERRLASANINSALALSPDGMVEVVQTTPDLNPHELTVIRDKKTQEEEAQIPEIPGGGTVLQIREVRSRRLMREMREPLRKRLIHVYRAAFTPDGRFLVLMLNTPAIRILETRTWDEVSGIAEVPSGSVAFYPSKDWSRAVLVSSAGEVDFWDVRQRRRLTRLDVGALQGAAFSPDGTMVAVVGVDLHADGSETDHMGIWEVSTGRFLHSLFPVEQVAHDGIGDPIWWKNSRHLLAPARDGHIGASVIGIWDVSAGRYRGSFSGCGLLDTPFTRVSLQGSLLLKACDSETLMWGVESAMEAVSHFEASLPLF